MNINKQKFEKLGWSYEKLDKLFTTSYMENRIGYLICNLVEPQIDEILNDMDFFVECLIETNLTELFDEKDLSKILVWIMFMSDKEIVKKYNTKFNKGFFNVCPYSDIRDLYMYIVYVEFYLERDTYSGLKEVIKKHLFYKSFNDNPFLRSI